MAAKNRPNRPLLDVSSFSGGDPMADILDSDLTHPVDPEPSRRVRGRPRKYRRHEPTPPDVIPDGVSKEPGPVSMNDPTPRPLNVKAEDQIQAGKVGKIQDREHSETAKSPVSQPFWWLLRMR